MKRRGMRCRFGITGTASSHGCGIRRIPKTSERIAAGVHFFGMVWWMVERVINVLACYFCDTMR
jgi:hypothetical protein